MKRSYLVYAALLVPALVLTVFLVHYLSASEYERALRSLDGSERTYRQARTTLVLGTGDPTGAVVRFATNPRNPDACRVQALRILGEIAAQRPVAGFGRQLLPLLDHGSNEFKAAALEALAAMKSTDVVAEVGRLFRETTDTVLFTAAYHMLRQAADPLTKAARAALSDSNHTAFDSCLALLEHVPGGKGLFYRHWAAHVRAEGDTTLAESLECRAGFVDSCWVAGPFDNAYQSAVTAPLSPEQRPFSIKDTFHLDDRTVAHWSLVTHIDDRGFINFNNLFAKRCCSIAYTYVPIISDSARDALLMLAYYEPVAVWFNDSLVHREVVYRSAFGDDDVVRLRLRPGMNHLLVKSVQDLASWRLEMRVADLRGNGFCR